MSTSMLLLIAGAAISLVSTLVALVISHFLDQRAQAAVRRHDDRRRTFDDRRAAYQAFYGVYSAALNDVEHRLEVRAAPFDAGWSGGLADAARRMALFGSQEVARLAAEAESCLLLAVRECNLQLKRPDGPELDEMGHPSGDNLVRRLAGCRVVREEFLRVMRRDLGVGDE